MKAADGHIIRKLVIVNVSSLGEIIQIDERLAGHINEIRAIGVNIVPASDLISVNKQCGELSLSINNHREHFFHISPGYTSELPSAHTETLPTNKEINGNSRLTGYWVDSRFMLDSEQQFVPYQVKILLECHIKPETINE